MGQQSYSAVIVLYASEKGNLKAPEIIMAAATSRGPERTGSEGKAFPPVSEGEVALRF